MRTIEGGGVRTGVWILIGAMLLVAIAFVAGVRFVRADRASRTPRVESRQPARHPPAAERDDREHREARPATASFQARPRARAREHLAENAPAAADPAPAADTDAPSDEPSGIALFPPPGTDPPKPGILVPEGFELPPGYVRHYQVTDDGKPLAAILMFHPDYEFLDAHGAPVELPEDLVVPPEMAPAGLPIEMLEVPETNVPMIEPEAGETKEQP